MKSYTFTVLRYVHDPVAEEFGNVGVVIHSQKSNFLAGKFRKSPGRLTKLFPDMNRADFQDVMRHLNKVFDKPRKSNSPDLKFGQSASTAAAAALPRDDSALRWSGDKSGIAKDLDAELDALYDRFVMRYDEASLRQKKTDDDVWKTFKKGLEKRQVLEHFRPKKIKADLGELDVKYAYKNGVWHCLEPLSFDLADIDNVHSKAYRWAGNMMAVGDAQEAFKMYFLLGRPQDESLEDAFDSAVHLLRKSHMDTEVFLEDEVDDLSDTLETVLSAIG